MDEDASLDTVEVRHSPLLRAPFGRSRDGSNRIFYAFEGIRKAMTYGRRGILATSGSLAIGVGLAGCSSSSSEEWTVGETVSNGGLKITFESLPSIRRSPSLDRREQGTGDRRRGRAGDQNVRTGGRSRVPCRRDDGERGRRTDRVPVPGGNLISTGELRFRVPGSERRPIPTATDDGRAIDDGYEFDGEVLDRLSLAVGSVQGELPAGESLAGWIPSRFPAQWIRVPRNWSTQ